MADTLQVLFDLSTDTLFAKLIRAACGPGPTHTETRFPDGRCFSAQLNEGVRWRQSIDTSDLKQWRVVDTPWKSTPEIVAWCDSIVGLPYDIIGAVDSGLGLAISRADAWFCSHTTAEIFSRAGAIGIPTLPCPVVLEKWIDRRIRLGRCGVCGEICMAELTFDIQQHYATLAKSPNYKTNVADLLHAVQAEQIAKGSKV